MPAPVAVYERTVSASLARVWENVLDWEHLPHLHHTSFRAIRLLAGTRDGWRAELALPARDAEVTATIEVELDRPRCLYVTRTLSGAGEGTEITTRLEPRGERTAIAVEFVVPDLPAGREQVVGDAYTTLYARLWDEDEGMMIRREEVLRGVNGLGFRDRGAVPAGARLALGPAAALSPNPRLVEAHGRRWRIVEVEKRLIVHSTVCPHLGGPLEEAPVTDGCVTCPWHGYRYDVRTGRGQDGVALRLDPAPRLEIDPRTDEVFLVFGKEAT